MTTTFAWRLDGLAVSKTVDESMSQGRPLKDVPLRTSEKQKPCWKVEMKHLLQWNREKNRYYSVKLMFRDSKHQPTWVSCVETGFKQSQVISPLPCFSKSPAQGHERHPGYCEASGKSLASESGWPQNLSQTSCLYVICPSYIHSWFFATQVVENMLSAIFRSVQQTFKKKKDDCQPDHCLDCYRLQQFYRQLSEKNGLFLPQAVAELCRSSEAVSKAEVGSGLICVCISLAINISIYTDRCMYILYVCIYTYMQIKCICLVCICICTNNIQLYTMAQHFWVYPSWKCELHDIPKENKHAVTGRASIIPPHIATRPAQATPYLPGDLFDAANGPKIRLPRWKEEFKPGWKCAFFHTVDASEILLTSWGW